MESFEEFRTRIQNHKSLKITVTNSLGVYDAFKYYRKTRPKDKKYVLKDVQYFKIIRMVNEHFADEIALGHDVVLPCHMGRIELRKFEYSIRIGKNGKVINNLPIDWQATIRLWYEDKEAYQKRQVIRLNWKTAYRIHYARHNAYYTNRRYFEFRFNQQLRKRLKENILLGVVTDAAWLRSRDI